jgi:Ser/Thr protein kinase RdoA (MazF antagonist)
MIEKILKEYGLSWVKVLPAQKGYRNQSNPVVLDDGSIVNLIMYKSEPGILAKIHSANAVADYLAGKGYPARSMYDKRLICLSAGKRQKYAALYKYLPGKTIPWEAYTMERIKALGQAMSDMHALLKSLDVALPSIVDECLRLCKAMNVYFANSGVQTAMHVKLGLGFDCELLDRYHKLIYKCSQLNNQQALHMDFVRGNIIFEDDLISGVIDFEKTSFGHPLFDVARTLAFLLVDCKYKSEDKIRKYFLTSGYSKRGGLKLLNLAMRFEGSATYILEELVSFFLLYDLYKFLLHNPYESLELNEHYKRTKTILADRGVISIV